MDYEKFKEEESAEIVLLNLSRHGNTDEIEKLLLQSTNLDINHIGMFFNKKFNKLFNFQNSFL